MNKHHKILLSIIAVCLVAFFLLRGDLITAKRVKCSDTPGINTVYVTGDQLVAHWTDTGKVEAQGKYEVELFRQSHGSYSLVRIDLVSHNRYSYSDLPIGSYLIRVRAKNQNCDQDYSNYAQSETVTVSAE